MPLFNKIQFTTKWFPTREENARLDFQTRCICALYARLLKEEKIKMPDAWGVVVEYSPSSEGPACALVKPLLPVLW